MFAAVLATLMAADVKPVITDASLFKNGFAVIRREIALTGGEATITEIPVASLGTFWVSASDGVKITEVVRTHREVAGSRNAQSLDEILRLNVGKTLLFGVQGGDEVVGKQITGKLIAADGQIVLIESERGIQAIPKGAISSVTAAQGELLYKMDEKRMEPILRIRTANGSSGTIYTVSLERGLTWQPSYAVDLSDEKELTLAAKSTVVNDLADITNIETKFVTGYPNVQWASILDPLLSGQSVEQFTGFLKDAGMPAAGFANRREIMNQAAPGAVQDFIGSFDTSDLGGFQAEDLFFYRQPGVTLKKGDRAYYMLFSFKSPYEHVYTLQLPDAVANNIEYRPLPEGPNDVWHEIKFKNNSSQPLTTAPTTVFKDREILAQATVMYTPPGSEIMFPMTKALDIRAEQQEEEVSRERAALKIPSTSVTYDLITLKGTVEIRNAKKEAVKMKITKELTGEFLSSSLTAKATKLPKGVRDINPRVRLVWEPTVAGGKTLTISYSYQLYVRTF